MTETTTAGTGTKQATPEQTSWLRSLLGVGTPEGGALPECGSALAAPTAAWDRAKARAAELYDEADAATNRAGAALCGAVSSGIGRVADGVTAHPLGTLATLAKEAAILTPGLGLPVLAADGAVTLAGALENAPKVPPAAPPRPEQPHAQAEREREELDRHNEEVERERRALRQRIASRRRQVEADRAARRERGEAETAYDKAHEAELRAAEQRLRREMLLREEAAEPFEKFDVHGARNDGDGR